MTSRLVDQLPLPQRLALAYSPAASRKQFMAFFAFDVRLGHAIRQASEPILGQIRLAWWRDQLSLPPGQRERSDPVIEALSALTGSESELQRLVDGWEGLLLGKFKREAVAELALARAEALVALAGLIGATDVPDCVRQCATIWALADLASGVGSSDERELVFGIAQEIGSGPVSLSRDLRPLFVLYCLSRTAILQRSSRIIRGPSSIFYVMRFRLFGR